MADLVDQYLAQLAGANTSAPSEPIWVKGNKPGDANNQYKTLEELQNDLFAAAATRSPEYNKVVQNLYDANFISKAQMSQAPSVKAALAYPVQMYQAYASRAGDNTVSFNKWFDWYTSTAGSRSSGGSGSGYSGPVTTTSVTVTDENSAESLLNNYARDLLGRGLTKQETQKYIKQFNQAERDSPQVTVSSGSGATRTSTTETATSKEEILREVVSKNPDFAKYQVDTTIMDMLMDDIQKAKVMING